MNKTDLLRVGRDVLKPSDSGDVVEWLAVERVIILLPLGEQPLGLTRAPILYPDFGLHWNSLASMSWGELAVMMIKAKEAATVERHAVEVRRRRAIHIVD